MGKLKYWGVAAITSLLIGTAFWWVMSEMKDRNAPLNHSDAFVYRDIGILDWFELTSRNGKVEGNLHQQKIIEKVGEPPFMQDKKYFLTGKATEKGYEFKVKNGGHMMVFFAWFSGGNLLVQKQGEKDPKLYKAVEKVELDKDVKSLQQNLRVAIYHSEEKEKTRLKNFFSELTSVYGYLYSSQNGQFQLFIKIDEALIQGEVRGSLLVMTDTRDKNKPYKETRYILNGITDGIMVEFFTTVDGKEAKLKGNFQKDASSFNLSFWMTNQKLPFHAVNEEEFKQSYEGFKTKVQNKDKN